MIPPDIFFCRSSSDAGFQRRIRIIWRFEPGLHASRRLFGRHETILWFTETDECTFNLGAPVDGGLRASGEPAKTGGPRTPRSRRQ